MRLFGRGIDLLVTALAIIVWAFATYVIATRFLSETAGALLGVAVLLSGLALILGGYLRDNRMQSLLKGRCPRCGEAVRHEHRHRRWDPHTRSWADPFTGWDCPACGYSHSEDWDCPACPAAEDPILGA